MSSVRQNDPGNVSNERVPSEVGFIRSGIRQNFDRKGAILFATADGAIELRIDPAITKRWAEIQWRDFVSRTPNVISIGSKRGKTFLPAHVHDYIAAHHLTLYAEQVSDDGGAKGVFPAEPAEIRAFVVWNGPSVRRKLSSGATT